MLQCREVRDFHAITRGEIDFPPVQHTILFSRFQLKSMRAIARAKFTIFNQLMHNHIENDGPI